MRSHDRPMLLLELSSSLSLLALNELIDHHPRVDISWKGLQPFEFDPESDKFVEVG